MVAITMNMPARSVNKDQSNWELTKRLDYTNDVQYLSEICACETTLFEQSELGQMHTLDTSMCVIGKQKKKYNPMNLYDIFAAYTNNTGSEIKDLVLQEILENKHWYRQAGHVLLGMHGITFDDWLKQLRYKKTAGDEQCVYALSALFRRHTIIHNAIQPWFTLKRTSGMTFNVICEISETHLLYLGNNAFCELHRKPTNIVCPEIVLLEEIQYTRELYHDHNIPEMYIKIKRAFNEPSSQEEESNAEEPPTEPQKLVIDHERTSGVIHLDMFDDSYIDWLKCKLDIKVEESAKIKVEPSDPP